MNSLFSKDIQIGNMPKCKIIRYYFSPKKMDATDVGKKMEKSEFHILFLGMFLVLF
jgi:hypothetical protein